MKYLLMVLVFGLVGCTVEEVAEETPKKEKTWVYIVAGQSNAFNCDWSYFEDLTGSRVVDLSIPGYLIDWLIADTDYSLLEDADAILFVHGEADSMNKYKGVGYVESVEEYRKLLGGAPLFISTVGYYDKVADVHFDEIRNAVTDEAAVNDEWFIAFDDAKNFRDWGMLSDGIHFTDEGCRMMMDAFAEQTYITF